MDVRFGFATKEWHEFFRQNVIQATGLDPDEPMEIRQGDVTVAATLVNAEDIALDGSELPRLTFLIDKKA